MMHHPTILTAQSTLFLVLDFQQRIVNAVANSEAVTAEILKLLKGANLLSVPILVTEQYPQGLGSTVSLLDQELQFCTKIEKNSFSAWDMLAFQEILNQKKRKQIVLMGIETHICILQTALDLLANGFQVHLPYNATASRLESNKENAVIRLREAGGIITNTESVLFELLENTKNPVFKAVQKLIL